MPFGGNIYTYMNETAYKKYLVRQLGLKEAQFVPFVREDEHPDIDPEAQMQPKVSPTAIPTPIIAVGIRGSVTGGLPSGADQTPDLAPTKLGGYDRVSPEDLNTKLVDKTPPNPEIKQQSNPINQNPSTGHGVTHPHQIQVTAGEEPQSTTGASTDSDPTLKLKSAQPKGIDIDITEKDEEPTHEEENPMIPATSLSEGVDPRGLSGALLKILNGAITAKRLFRNTKDPAKKEHFRQSGLALTKKFNDASEQYKTMTGKTWGEHIANKPNETWFQDTPQQPPTNPSLQETFERHKRLALEIIKRHSECVPCGCGDPNDTHGHGTPKNEGFADDLRKSQKHIGGDSRKEAEVRDKILTGLKKKVKDSKPKKDAEGNEQGLSEEVECQKCHQQFDFNLVAEVAMGAVKCPACNAIINQEGQALFEAKHKDGCQCGFCKNKGSFGKKKDVKEDGGGDDPDFKEKDAKQWRKDRSASKEGEEVRKHLDKDKKDKADNLDEGKDDSRVCGICGQKHPCSCDKKDELDAELLRKNPSAYRKDLERTKGGRTDKKFGLHESYSPPFARMRGLAGIGDVILSSNGNWTNTTIEEHLPGAAHPFTTHWKMDKEKAGMVKVDEAKLQKVYEALNKKSKRGTLSDKELLLTKRIGEALKKRGLVK